MAKPHPPAIFKWRHFAPEVILCAVRWYLRYSLSYRDVQELLVERGLEIDHTTVWRWVQHYAPELEERTRPHLKSTNKPMFPCPILLRNLSVSPSVESLIGYFGGAQLAPWAGQGQRI